MKEKVCRDPGSNRGPSDLRSDALPAELSRLDCKENASAINVGTCAQKEMKLKKGKATPRGFEPLRAEPNGFRVHLLNRSDTVSVYFMKGII